jgi:hypothetical protein
LENCSQNWDVNTVNFSLDFAAGQYFESGFYESGTAGSGTHPITMFWEYYIPPAQPVFVTVAPCGAQTNDLGYAQFRIYRYWGNTWIADTDCTGGGSWVNVKTQTFARSYDFGMPRAEFERFPDTNTYTTYHSLLQYRDINNGVWYPWQGMACRSSQSIAVQLNRLSSNAFNLVPGNGC